MRALVVVCRYLGDTLLATPLARSLHQAGYEVDWLVAPGCDGLIQGQPYTSQVFVLKPTLASTLGLIRQLFRRYDIACVINGADRPMSVALCAAKKTYALIPDRWQDWWKAALCSGCIHNREDVHIVRYALELAELAGVKPKPDVILEWNDADKALVNKKLGWKRKSFIHIHPFARWPYKHWPEKHWRGLIETLLEHDLQLVLTGSPKEQDAARELVAGLDPARIKVICGELSWPQLACLSSMALCYIGLDTANTHLAASTGVPVVALFGPTNPTIWGPWPNASDSVVPYTRSPASGHLQVAGNIHLLQGLQPCVPCHREGCDRRADSRSECLDSLMPELVWDTIRKAAVLPDTGSSA